MGNKRRIGAVGLDKLRYQASRAEARGARQEGSEPTAVGGGREQAADEKDAHPPQDVLMSPEEVMRYLKIGRTMCYSLLSEGAIRSSRVGRLRRVKKSDVDRYLLEGRAS